MTDNFDIAAMRRMATLISPFAGQAILQCCDEIERLQARASLAQPASVPALDKQAAFEAWLENYPIQVVGDDYELCSDAFDAGLLAAAPQAPQPAQAVPDADAERFRWLIDDRNWNENEDTPSICTSEDVHWGDKARSLIDRHMKKD